MIDLNSQHKIDLSNAGDRLRAETTFHFPETRFGFLNGHYGLRRKRFHVLGASTGIGKTTIARAIIDDMAKTEKVMVWNTEETKENFEIAMIKSGKGDETARNISFYHESEECKGVDSKNIEEFKRILSMAIVNSGCSILIYDNITTSSFYPDKDSDQQGRFIRAIREVAIEYNIAVFAIVHLHPIPDHEIVSAKHIRGGKKVSIEAEYLYLMSSFIVPAAGELGQDIKQGYLVVEKDRHGDTQRNLYFINYDYRIKEVTGDTKKNFNQLIELYKKRAKFR